MTATQAQTGYGTKLEINTTGSTWVEVGELVDVGNITEKLNLVDATHMQSPNSFMERLPTFFEPGDVNCTVHYVPTNAGLQACRTAFAARAVKNFRLTCTALNYRIAFAAYVSQLDRALPHDNVVSGTLVLSTTGGYTETQADGTAFP